MNWHYSGIHAFACEHSQWFPQDIYPASARWYICSAWSSLLWSRFRVLETVDGSKVEYVLLVLVPPVFVPASARKKTCSALLKMKLALG